MFKKSGRARDSAIKTAADFWSRQTREPRKWMTWGNFPAIRHHITQRLIGKDIFSISFAVLERAKKLHGVSFPVGHAVSVGAGTCVKETALAKAGYVERWDCFEFSAARIEAARKRAADADLGARMNYRCEDAFRAECPQYDMVFWSQSLHHMFDIAEALQWSLDHLKPGGLFIMDEFVGPNRFQWSDETLRVASDVRAALDDRHLILPGNPDKRFPRTMRRPNPKSIADADPTESVASEEILPRLAEYMPDAEVVPLGGVVYQVALSGVLTNFTEHDEALLKSLLVLDGILADQGHSVLAAATCRKPG